LQQRLGADNRVDRLERGSGSNGLGGHGVVVRGRVQGFKGFRVQEFKGVQLLNP
jgi:hypothetical protein